MLVLYKQRVHLSYYTVSSIKHRTYKTFQRVYEYSVWNNLVIYNFIFHMHMPTTYTVGVIYNFRNAINNSIQNVSIYTLIKIYLKILNYSKIDYDYVLGKIFHVYKKSHDYVLYIFLILICLFLVEGISCQKSWYIVCIVKLFWWYLFMII